MPLFFLLLFGIIEAGRFIFYYETLSNATREGARYAIVNGANTLGCPSGPPAPGSSACDTSGNNVVGPCRANPGCRPGSRSTITVTARTLDPGQRPRVDL